LRPAAAKPVLRQALATLREAGTLARKGTILHLAAHRVQPTAAELSLWKRVDPALASGGVRPPRVRELADLTGLTLEAIEAHLARAEQLGWVHRVASNRFYLPEALEELERMAGTLAAESPDGAFTAADFNRVSGIGRNLTIQVLEYLDRIGVTKRDGDRRRLAHPAAPEGHV
jgi:selenocysteine-specific elongation factor